MAKPEQHASPDSLLGQIQRGRGEGYLRILSTPKREACELLVDCICNDPRLDSQLENRAEYYASIAVEVGLDLAPLAQYLREHDDTEASGAWNTPLTVETLGELAKRGYRDAAGVLCDYVAWGQWWDCELGTLMALPDPEIHAKVAGAIERHFPSDDELEKALAWLHLNETPWVTLAQQGKRIGKFGNNLRGKERVASAERPSCLNLTSLTPKQLLGLADSSNRHKLHKAVVQIVTPSDVDLLMENVSLDKPFVADVALAGLAHLAPEGIFGWLKHFWSANPEMPGFLRHRTAEVMISLSPALTLPLARERLFHEKSHERYLAEHLFEAHAGLEDIPVLRAALKEALQDDDEFCYRLCNLVEAFSHLPDAGPVPELSDVFVQFRYSYGRSRAADAISVTSPDLFQEGFALECLWDCQYRTRVLGAKFVPLGDKASAGRLHALALSPWEEKEVRAEAAKRIAVNQVIVDGR
jgi:hypothetical protein